MAVNDHLDLLVQELGFVPDQREALKSLLNGKDVFCVLPTGFAVVLFNFNSCLLSVGVFCFSLICEKQRSTVSNLCSAH